MSKKMLVVPEELLSSLLYKSKIVEDPLVSAQIEKEKEREKLLHSDQPLEQVVMKYGDLSQKANVIDEQRKQNLSQPIPVKIVDSALLPQPKKVKPKRPKLKLKQIRQQMKKRLSSVSYKKPEFLERFYEYEPEMMQFSSPMSFQSAVSPKGEDLSERIARTISAPKKTRAKDPVLQTVVDLPLSMTKRTRTGREYD